MYEIKLPSLKWFETENIYTGSLGTDPAHGCLGTTTFNYRVQCVSTDNGKALLAQCWFEPPWNSAEKKSDVLWERFELTDSGIEEVKKWLRSKFTVSGTSVLPAPQKK